MTEATLKKLHDWLKAHEDELLQETLAILRIPSVESDPQPNAPFGEGNRKALDYALGLAGKYGMRATDLEGYLGYADFGEDGPLIASFGHLDVVPTGPGWKHDPFGAEIVDGYIYSRGSTDDKGPTMASFFALRAIQECCPELKVRFRQAFGCNEESGFKCVERYVQTEEAPTFGVAPDSGWPLFHGEKGIANLEITVPVPESTFKLLDLAGGQRPNIVIDSCSAKVKVAPEVRGEVEAKIADAWDRNVTATWDGNTLHVVAVGKAAHGAWPFGGDSAATRVLRFLVDLAPLSAKSFYEELFSSTHPGGAGLGIAGSDEPSLDLTSNLGIVKVVDGVVNLLFNIRYPVTWTGEKLKTMCLTYLAKLQNPFKLEVVRDSPPLYFPLDHPLVKTIVDVYEQETGERKEPGVMGGGTYARAIPNTVSIGTCWAGDGNAHETDERLAIDSLYKMARIYVHIFYRLAEVAM